MIPQPCEICGYDGDDNNNHIKHCHGIIRKLTERLREYARKDEDAIGNGYGCFTHPTVTVERWIEEIIGR